MNDKSTAAHTHFLLRVPGKYSEWVLKERTKEMFQCLLLCPHTPMSGWLSCVGADLHCPMRRKREDRPSYKLIQAIED